MAVRNPICEERVNLTEEYIMNCYSLDNAAIKDLINKSIESNQKLFGCKKRVFGQND